MSFTIVIVMLLAAGGVILGVANASLLAWSRGASRHFPIDRDDTDEVRLVKLGVDTMFGLLPVFLAMVLQVLSISAPLQLSLSQQIGTIVGTLVYLLLYFAFIRRRYSAFRLKIRRMLTGHGESGDK